MKGNQRAANVKTHHLFVKVPPKRSARFERMVKRNRTLEHEVKVYTELIQDLKQFVKDRVGTAINFNVPTLYHGYTAKNDPGPDGDRSVLVIEDLSQHGKVMVVLSVSVNNNKYIIYMLAKGKYLRHL